MPARAPVRAVDVGETHQRLTAALGLAASCRQLCRSLAPAAWPPFAQVPPLRRQQRPRGQPFRAASRSLMVSERVARSLHGRGARGCGRNRRDTQGSGSARLSLPRARRSRRRSCTWVLPVERGYRNTAGGQRRARSCVAYLRRPRTGRGRGSRGSCRGPFLRSTTYRRTEHRLS